MDTSDDLISLLAEDEQPDPGSGLYPLKPATSGGSVVRSASESDINWWQVEDLALSDEGRTSGWRAIVTLTSERLIFEIPDWKKGSGLMNRVTAEVGQRAFKERWVLAGHLPLESITDVGNGVGRRSVVTVSVMGRFGGGMEKVTLSWVGSKEAVKAFVDLAMKASKERWKQHSEVAAELREEIAATEATTDTIGNFLTGKMQTLDYRSPAALALNTKVTFSPTHSFEGDLRLEPLGSGWR